MIVIGDCLPQILIRASLKKRAGRLQLHHVLSCCLLLTRLVVKHQVSSVNVDYNITIPSDPGSLSSHYIVKQSFVKSEGFIVGLIFFFPCLTRGYLISIFHSHNKDTESHDKPMCNYKLGQTLTVNLILFKSLTVLVFHCHSTV